jgi:cyclopropane fatty-acyl-phospholipid synthase-like methyltransferase
VSGDEPDRETARRVSGRRRTTAEFDAVYAEGTPPWDIGRPQPALQALADAGELRGRVLDSGCGTGEHTLMAAALGLDATGVDASPTAIGKAEQKARERELQPRFLVHDVLDLGSLGETFDIVIDSGVFHVFDDQDRAQYVESLQTATQPGARLFLLCFSELQPGEFGPRRITEGELRESFTEGWQIDSLERTTMTVTFAPEFVQAWLASMTRR